VSSIYTPPKYRLPGGAETTNVAAYAQEWAALSREFLVLLPGWVMLSYDPGLAFADRASSDVLRISVRAARRILDSHRAILENAVRLAQPGAVETIRRVEAATARAEAKRRGRR
jgi:hypothetical protein